MISRCHVLCLALVAALFSTTQAEVQTEPFEYRHNGETLTGYFAYDDAIEGPRPGVLVVHAWWGLGDSEKRRARMLAEMGYVAFALDMYGSGKLTDDPKQASQWAGRFRADRALMRSRAEAGLQVLRTHGKVDRDRVAAIGYCFGGGVVLEMAYDGQPVLGVVPFHGSLPVPDENRKAPIEPRILACHGAADPLVGDKAVQAWQHAMERLNADWTMILYGGAEHSFTEPKADEHGIDGVSYQAAADRRSWRDMQQFFRELFQSRHTN